MYERETHQASGDLAESSKLSSRRGQFPHLEGQHNDAFNS